MNENKNKILVALDGSKKAFKTIDYLCNFKPFLKKELVLHNVIAKVPECYYDLKKEPFTNKVTSQVHAWERGYKAQVDAFMEKSRMMLIAAGFKPEAIHLMIAKRKKGIARDIMDEARKGYYALLIRRRGSGAQKFLPLVMGSVSTKLVEKSDFIPVMLAGVQKVNHSLFITVDGSKGAKRAVEFAAKMIENSDCKIVLCSVLRDYGIYDDGAPMGEPDNYITTAVGKMDIAVKEARDIFENAGIPDQNIEVKIIQGAKSRAGAIVTAAKQKNCDTIVFGRKGKSNVSSFDIGRVPWKVIHGAREMTVWMVP
jgi:nucleotide-binding universal stress UspA family protein